MITAKRFDVMPFDNGCEEILYESPRFEFEPGVTILAGCNGTGKTTLLKRMEEMLRKAQIPVLLFSQEHAKDELNKRVAFSSDANALWAYMANGSESEGESHLTQLVPFVGNFRHFVFNTQSEISNDRWLLLDSLDSGLSMDSIDQIRSLLDAIVETTPESVNLYVIVSANDFELVRNYDAIDVMSGKRFKFNNYEWYAKFVRDSAERKLNRKEISEREWDSKYQKINNELVTEDI